MDESKWRELAEALRGELSLVIADAAERSRAAAEIDAALALPTGYAKQELLIVIRARRETRRWAATYTGADAEDVYRGFSPLPGGPTAPLGVHVVCPNGDYDRYLETPTEDPGRCPHDGMKLVRADG